MVSLGEELKRERELREITLREISEATKISIRILEAIENDNYRILPGGVFNRNFLRAYAGFIGLDPESIVRKYQQVYSGAAEDSLPEGLRRPTDEASDNPGRKKTVLLLVAFGVLLIIAVVVYWISK
jgi:cytoskeletal protein RodZ